MWQLILFAFTGIHNFLQYSLSFCKIRQEVYMEAMDINLEKNMGIWAFCIFQVKYLFKSCVIPGIHDNLKKICSTFIKEKMIISKPQTVQLHQV